MNRVVASVSLVSYVTPLPTNPTVAIVDEDISNFTPNFDIEFASNFNVLQVHQALRKSNDCILSLGLVSHIWSCIQFSHHIFNQQDFHIQYLRPSFISNMCRE